LAGSKHLLNKKPIVVDTDLATCFGVNEAIVIQQVHYWLEVNKEAGKNYINDRHWTYNTIADWQSLNFPFWSYDTVKRIFSKLESEGILLADNFNEMKRDRTKWYSIDYEKLDELMEKHDNQKANSPNALGQSAPMSLGQNAPLDWGNLHQPLPEINTEITREIKDIRPTSKKSDESQVDKKHPPTIVALTELLIRKITDNNPRASVPEKGTSTYSKWISEMEKLHRLGPIGGDSSKGYSIEEIKGLILWCQEDSFWKNNILSAGKLREKVVMLENQMKKQQSDKGVQKNKPPNRFHNFEAKTFEYTNDELENMLRHRQKNQWGRSGEE
jgi:hypothetical protein